MARASVVCRRLMTIPGVGQLTALAFVAAIDDPSVACGQRLADCDFNLAALHPAYPIKRRTSA
jgi:hypothetical protein